MLNLDQFLDHKSNAGGGKYLSWKEDGHARIWLHPEAQFYPIWSSRWWAVDEVEDAKTKEKENKVFSRKFVSHEREMVLKKQNHYSKKTGLREMPPKICPMSIMIDWVKQQVEAGKISWVEPIFVFEGDDPTSEYNARILAGGMYNAFSRDDLTKEEKREIQKAGVRIDEAYYQDLRPKLNYLFIVVGDPEEGVRLAYEGKALGDKMKSAMRDTLRVRGEQRGNPLLNPFPFEWTYDEEKNFDEKYHVIALEDPLTDDVRDAFKEPVPDVSALTEPGDCLWLYKSMQAHCVYEPGLPWELFFGAAEKAGLMKENPKRDTDSNGIPNIGGDDGPVSEKPAAAAKATKPTAATAPAKEPPKGEAETLYECEHCDAEVLRASDSECSACGAQFDLESMQLIARPCECKTVVKIAEGERSICPKCGTIYNNADWSVFKRPEPAAAKETASEPAKPKRRSAIAAAAKDGGDGIPWNK